MDTFTYTILLVLTLIDNRSSIYLNRMLLSICNITNNIHTIYNITNNINTIYNITNNIHTIDFHKEVISDIFN